MTLQHKSITSFTSFKYNAMYSSAFKYLRIKRNNSVNIAVIVHLYYFDSWELIKNKLKLIDPDIFDLFITIPTSNLQFVDIINADFNNAYIVQVPNMGRDVLPFIMIMELIKKNGYTSFLKIHSKKSTHRTDGKDWNMKILDNLIPNNPKIISNITTTLGLGSTGIIGPADQYLPLTINFEANGMHMTRIIKNIYSKKISQEILQEKRNEFGFFAGTMFWGRIDAIDKVLSQNIKLRDFDRERGQIDGTFAHALERIFSIVPEIENKSMYQVDNQKLIKISYISDNIPDWSDVYIGINS